MPQIRRDHLFILPRAEEYRTLYSISYDDLLTTLNSPDRKEGLATDHYTAERAMNTHRIYVYYYLTYPLQAQQDERYVIVDFIGYTEQEPQKRTSARSCS